MKPFRCILLIPGVHEPQVLTFCEDDEGTLPILQGLVGGLVDCVSLAPDFDLWCHDSGLLLGLQRNRFRLAGNVVVTRSDEEGRTKSLDDLDVHRLRALLSRVPV